MSDPIKKFYLKERKILRILFFVLSDAVFICLGVVLAFFFRFEGEIPSSYLGNISGLILLSLVLTIPIFYFSKLYFFSWMYVSTTELISLAKAQALSFLLISAAIFILRDWSVFIGLPRSTIFISSVFIFLFSGGFRLSKRIVLQLFRSIGSKEKDRTLIVGAGDAGEQILRNILSFKNGPYFPIGFVDDNPGKQGLLIHGLKVLGKINDIPEIAQQEKAQSLIIALPSAGAETIKKAVELGRQSRIKKIKILPLIDEVNLNALQDVATEDLLGREAVSLNRETIKNFIQDKKVLVTGAAGSIGSELCRQIIKFNPQYLFLLDQDETGIFNISNELKNNFPAIKAFVADITDKEGLNYIFQNIQPQVVFHAAAYKHVPLMEENAAEAVKNNILGTQNVVEVSLPGAKKFIFISTDKAVNPVSIMGITKRMGEIICQARNKLDKTKFISVRFGNVLDSRGNVVQLFKEQIEKRQRGEPAIIEITHPEMKRYFMTTSEACQLVLQAGAMGQGGEVFVLDMGEPMKIIDLARQMIKLSGFEPDKDIPIVISQPRPGEKLFEEILTAEEGTVATRNQKIFRARLLDINQEKERILNLALQDFKNSAKIRGDKEKLKELISQLL